MDGRAAEAEVNLLYHFCRLRLPAVALPLSSFERHVRRGFGLYQARLRKEGRTPEYRLFLEDLHAVDWFLACACLDGLSRAWEALFASRANRSDCLLVDALRARAVRLFPRDESRQEQAVAEFWGYLLAGERDGSVPILARYDGQRPLVPWLIRVFQNKLLSELRHGHDLVALPDDWTDGDLPMPGNGDERWHREFRAAAHDWLQGLADNELLILGLRLRYRLSQREAAKVLGIHEGNVGRQTDKLSQRCRAEIGQKMHEVGWTGDDLDGLIMKEMDSLLLDEPRLSADRLAALLAARGKGVPLPVGEPGA